MTGGAPNVYSVKEFTSRLGQLFARHSKLSNIAIQGEISDLRTFGNGHMGFRLKEEQAVIECVAWSDRRRELPEVKNGIAVIAYGSVGVRADRGCYQLVVERLEPTGIGALFLLYERLKEKFAAEGLFEASRKRRVPELPRRVALVSARGEAMADFTQTLAREAPFVEVRFIETRVQGEGAEIDIAAAIDEASRGEPDVIVVTRGGGSYEDLFPFNLEPVVRAIVRSQRAVVTAIGHVQHHHLADAVADMNFQTPSLAAKHIAQGWTLAARRVREADRALRRAVANAVLSAARGTEDAELRLTHASERAMSRRREELSRLWILLDSRSPRQWIAQRRERLLKLESRVASTAERFVNGAQRKFEHATAQLNRLDPLAPLARGYAIVTRGGEAVRDAALLRKGDAIAARFARGTAAAVVESVDGDV